MVVVVKVVADMVATVQKRQVTRRAVASRSLPQRGTQVVAIFPTTTTTSSSSAGWVGRVLRLGGLASFLVGACSGGCCSSGRCGRREHSRQDEVNRAVQNNERESLEAGPLGGKPGVKIRDARNYQRVEKDSRNLRYENMQGMFMRRKSLSLGAPFWGGILYLLAVSAS
jgi:hypothetical protein